MKKIRAPAGRAEITGIHGPRGWQVGPAPESARWAPSLARPRRSYPIRQSADEARGEGTPVIRPFPYATPSMRYCNNDRALLLPLYLLRPPPKS